MIIPESAREQPHPDFSIIINFILKHIIFQ
jgi:hypothetical protein